MRRTETTLISFEEANTNPNLPFSYVGRHKALASIIETKVDPSKDYFKGPQEERSSCTATLIDHRSLSSFLVVYYQELWTLVHNNKIIRKETTKGDCYTNLLYFNDYYYLYNMLKDRLEVVKYDNSEKLKILPFRFRCYGVNQGLHALPQSDRYIAVKVKSESVQLLDTKETKMDVMFEKEDEPHSLIKDFFCVNKDTILLVQSLDLCLLSLVLDGEGKVTKTEKIRKFPIYLYLTKNSLPPSLQNLGGIPRSELPRSQLFRSCKFSQKVGIFLATSQITGYTHLIKIQPKKEAKAVSLLAVVNLNKNKSDSDHFKSFMFDYNILGISKNKKMVVLQVGKSTMEIIEEGIEAEVRRVVFDLQRRKVLGRYSELLKAFIPGMGAQVRCYNDWFCDVTGHGIRFLEKLKI